MLIKAIGFILLITEIFYRFVVDQAVDGACICLGIQIIHGSAKHHTPFGNDQRIADIHDQCGKGNDSKPHQPLLVREGLVADIVRRGGLASLLALAQQVEHIDGEPMHRALVGAADPHEFLARWQRMERYVHASHRVGLLGHARRGLHLEHRGKPLPQPAESLAVLGVWIGALRAIGTTGLAVRIDGRPVHPRPAGLERTLRKLAAAGRLRAWTLEWKGGSSAAMRPAEAQVLPETSLGAAPHWGEPAAALARWLARDPAAAPRLAAAAAALGLSVRTLQRRLAERGTGFAELLGEVRVRLAAAYLVQSGHGVAEIGYLCGFADQPHVHTI